MTRPYHPQTNAEFVENVNYQIGDLVAAPGDQDNGFSWYPCALCESSLGGDRYEIVLLGRPAKDCTQIRVSACTDCLMWVANGQLPFEETAL